MCLELATILDENVLRWVSLVRLLRLSSGTGSGRPDFRRAINAVDTVAALCRIHVHESVAAGALSDARDERRVARGTVTCTSQALCLAKVRECTDLSTYSTYTMKYT